MVDEKRETSFPRYIDANKIEYTDRIPIYTADGRYQVGWEKAAPQSAIDKIPTADVEQVVHAHWDCYKCSRFLGWKDGEAEPRWADGKFYCCSRCRRRTVIREKYCPSCHAKMDEEVEYDNSQTD